MPQGYIFLGSEDEDFNRRFTLDHFELRSRPEDGTKWELELYDKYYPMLSKTKEELNDEDLYQIGRYADTARYKGKDFSYAMLHCFMCNKAHIDMSHAYCRPCEFEPHKYIDKK